MRTKRHSSSRAKVRRSETSCSWLAGSLFLLRTPPPSSRSFSDLQCSVDVGEREPDTLDTRTWKKSKLGVFRFEVVDAMSSCLVLLLLSMARGELANISHLFAVAAPFLSRRLLLDFLRAFVSRPRRCSRISSYHTQPTELTRHASVSLDSPYTPSLPLTSPHLSEPLRVSPSSTIPAMSESNKLVISPHAEGLARLTFSPNGRYGLSFRFLLERKLIASLLPPTTATSTPAAMRATCASSTRVWTWRTRRNR